MKALQHDDMHRSPPSWAEGAMASVWAADHAGSAPAMHDAAAGFLQHAAVHMGHLADADISLNSSRAVKG